MFFYLALGNSKMNNIKIRTATLDDLPTILKFEQGIIGAERPFDSTLLPGQIHYYDLGARITDADAAVVVGEDNGKLIAGGSAIIKRGNPYNTFTHYAFLGFMFVEPEYRGKGVNRLIIEALVDWSHKKGLNEIRLQVYSENLAAIRAYEKVGFKKILTEMRLA
jgi:GNAT superfamily N-acetyltransferase